MKYATLPLFCLVLSADLAQGDAAKPSAQEIEFFEKRIRPVFVEHCISCHGPKKQQASLRLDTRDGFLKGSDSGALVQSKEAEKSLLLVVVRHEETIKMPPKSKLPAQAIADLTTWVKRGAPFPTTAEKVAQPSLEEVRKTHWSLQPIRKQLPTVKNTTWPINDIDRFVLARLEDKGLTASADADRRTFLRRITFVLIGLPPTPEEITAFETDTSPEAHAKVVDRLLASPRYGERWAQHWLDVARYADTRGYVFTAERRFPFAYTYRDYVIRAFNEDLPYDRFIVEQLAADRLQLGEDKRPLAAMGFLTLGRRFLNNAHDIIDDRIDVTMRGLQGITVSCARCHDHKFDPIPIKDYYSLYGVFASSVEPNDLPRITTNKQPETAAYEKELAALQKAVADYEEKFKEELKAKNRKNTNELRGLQKKADQLKVTHPGAPASAMVLVEFPRPMEPQVFLRGNPNNRGDRVPRQYLQVLSSEKRQPFANGSGRLELAEAIASKNNPLTARVMVNRVWMHHFGQGLVRTPSDFGLRGEPPTHPELLDYLAASFMENGWSIKKLHREILLSRVYRQKSEDIAKAQAVDPENRLLGKFNRQRLDFESMRDALLAVTGKLDLSMGGPSVELTTAPFTPRRSVYGFIDRQNLPGLFRTFDLASPDAHTPQRYNTTVPQQALFLMNSPFVLEQADAVMKRADLVNITEPKQKIEKLYRLLYGRPIDKDELELGLKFVEQTKSWQRYAQVLMLANEFMFVD